jgi:hypothetical protein
MSVCLSFSIVYANLSAGSWEGRQQKEELLFFCFQTLENEQQKFWVGRILLLLIIKTKLQNGIIRTALNKI